MKKSLLFLLQQSQRWKKISPCLFLFPCGFSLVRNLRDANNYRYTKAAACCLRPYAFNTQVGITEWSGDFFYGSTKGHFIQTFKVLYSLCFSFLLSCGLQWRRSVQFKGNSAVEVSLVCGMSDWLDREHLIFAKTVFI